MSTDKSTDPAAARVMAGDAGEPTLQKGALSFISNFTMGIASAAPAYSAALTIGLLAAVSGMGAQTPAVLILSFIPLYLTATAYRALNSELPDCGTTFAWAARAIGPSSGWLGGWAILLAYTFILGIGAALASTYFFLLIGWHGGAESIWATTITGSLVIIASTWLCLIGVDISARAQRWLLYLEMTALGIFAVVVFVKQIGGASGYIAPSLSWLNPFAIDKWSAVADGLLLGVFMYWGWETSVAVSEESEHSRSTPGRAAVLSVVGLVFTYVIISVASQMVRGPGFLAEHNEDVLSATAGIALGSPLDKIVLLSVCTSAIAASITSLTTTARTTFSMARAKALPHQLNHVHPRWRTPWVSILAVSSVGLAYFLLFTIVSESFLTDSVGGVGLLVLFYYAITAFACSIFFRRKLKDGFRAAWTYVVAPAIGGLILAAAMVKAAIDYGKADAGELGAVAGIGTPLLIAVGSMVVGLVLMLILRGGDSTFFKLRREQSSGVEAPEVAEEPA
jgi:amino acid transporter